MAGVGGVRLGRGHSAHRVWPRTGPFPRCSLMGPGGGPGRWGAPNTDRFGVRHGVTRGYASIAATCKRSVRRPSFTNSPAFVQGVNTGRAYVTLFISLYPTSVDFSSTCRYVHYTSSAMWSPQLCYHTSTACHVTKIGKSCDKDHRILTAEGV